MFWRHPDSRWSPQLSELTKRKNVYESDHLRNADLDFGEIVTETDL